MGSTISSYSFRIPFGYLNDDTNCYHNLSINNNLSGNLCGNLSGNSCGNLSANLSANSSANSSDNSYNYPYPCIDASLNKNILSTSSLLSQDSNSFKFYKLYIYIDNYVDENIKNMYKENASKNNLLVDSYLEFYNNEDAQDFCYDAGFDLFCPRDYIVRTRSQCSFMLDHQIKCCMKVCSQNNYIEHYVGYYLYCRSSTATKTPLRLANSVGIIDSGYRGNIKACFDNNSNEDFTINYSHRYVQICPPNLEHPMKVYIVDNLEDLGKSTYRNIGGFGSSGY